MTRALCPVPVILILASCARPEPSEHAEPPATAESDCADGSDNDDDHLVDCEDGDCVSSCTEDCSDGSDDDDDGLTDCADDDCWGDSACSEAAALPSGTLIHSRVLSGGSFSFWDSWLYRGDDYARRELIDAGFIGRDIHGSFRVRLPYATASTSCTWSLQSATWSLTTDGYGGTGMADWSGQESIRRWGLQVSDGCPLNNQQFLPTAPQIGDGAVLADGVRWYQGAVTSSSRQGTWEVDSFDSMHSHKRRWQLSALHTGETYTAVIP